MTTIIWACMVPIWLCWMSHARLALMSVFANPDFFNSPIHWAKEGPVVLGRFSKIFFEWAIAG